MITIRQATTADIQLIHDMATVAFPNTYRDILSKDQTEFMMDWMYSNENLKRQMTIEQNDFYIASFNNTPAGYVSIRPEGVDLFHLEKIYVLPEYQKLKIGKALFMHAMKQIKLIHPSKCEMRLNVNRNNSAIHFYEHMGMKKVSEGDFHIGNGYYMNDYIMGITL